MKIKKFDLSDVDLLKKKYGWSDKKLEKHYKETFAYDINPNTGELVVYDADAFCDVMEYLATPEEKKILIRAEQILLKYGRQILPTKTFSPPRKPDALTILNKKEYAKFIKRLTTNGINKKWGITTDIFVDAFIKMEKDNIITFQKNITLIEYINKNFKGSGLAKTSVRDKMRGKR